MLKVLTQLTQSRHRWALHRISAMSLQPPSFFLAPRPALEPKTNDEQRPIDGAATSSAEDELSALKKENLALKQQLGSSGRSHIPDPPLLAPPSSAVLTSDLLQVEAHLQSRVRMLETERKELELQVERGKLLLVEKEERHVAELAEIRQTHKAAISKVQVERDGVVEDHNSLKKESQEMVSQLERQLTNSQQMCASQVEELNARIRQLEQSNAEMTGRLEEEHQAHAQVSSQLKEQLASSNTEKQGLREELEEQLKQLRSEVDVQSQQVRELESYLGGEIPREDLRRGVTWKEERETLVNTLQEQERGMERLQSENKLINIRLSSLSEILSIQEAEVAKQGEGCVSGDGGDRVNLVKSLLTRWREKVFVLLLQQKLQQMEDSKMAKENERERASLLDHIRNLETEKEKLSHTLVDRTAQLELQSNQTQDLQRELGVAHSAIDHLEDKLSFQSIHTNHLKSTALEMTEQFSVHRAAFAQALTRAVSLEQRLTFATRRLSSLSASLGCKMALLHSRSRPLPPAVESGCQTESTEPNQTDLSSFSREHLEQEVRSLATERDSLVLQLRESTQSFQKQLTNLKDSCTSRLAVMEGALTEVRQENSSLCDQLTGLQSHCSGLEEERDSLHQTVDELRTELNGAQATLDTKLETAVQKQRQKSMSELSEMEALVNVARREHAKAVVQLQQLQRQLDRDRDRAVEAVEMSKARLEHELEACRKKLHSSQAERNLLMTTLRQEGIVLPVKQSLTQRQDRERTPSDSATSSTQSDAEPIPPSCDTAVSNSETTDFRSVLKDLQVLSASLLEMETEETT